MNDLSNKAISGVFWRLAERIGAKSVSFIVSIILARILTPSDFGTISLIMVFMNIMQVFVDSGIGSALVQKKDVDELDYSTVFLFNMFMCSVLYILIFLLAPSIAQFFGNWSLAVYIRVLGLGLLISGITNIQQSYVTRELKFRVFFLSTLVGSVCGAVVGVLMAVLGFGVWALIGQTLINQLINCIVLLNVIKMKLNIKFSFYRLKFLFSFGWKLLVSTLLDTIYNNIRQLIIGKMYSPSDLAYFNRGDAMPQLIISSIVTSIDSVLFSTMSKYQDDVVRVKQMTKRAMGLTTYIIWPLMIGLLVVANPLVRILLTDKWLPAVPFLQIFAIAYAFWPLHTANLNAIKAVGRSDIFLRIEVIKKIFGISILLLSLPFGIMGMAWSLLVMSIAAVYINSVPTKRLIDYGFMEQIRDILPSFVRSIIMGVCIYPLYLLSFPIGVVLMLQIIIGALIYVALSFFEKDKNFVYILSYVKKKRSR